MPGWKEIFGGFDKNPPAATLASVVLMGFLMLQMINTSLGASYQQLNNMQAQILSLTNRALTALEGVQKSDEREKYWMQQAKQAQDDNEYNLKKYIRLQTDFSEMETRFDQYRKTHP